MTAVDRLSTAAAARLVGLLLLATVLAAEDPQPWRQDFPVGLASAEGKPIALLFSIESCGWCHKMLAESAASADVRRALGEVVGFHVDGHRERGLVARLGIQSYPTLVLVNRKGELVRVVPGYLPATDLSTALRVLAMHGDEEGMQPAALSGGADIAAIRRGPDAIARLVALLGSGPSEQRREVRAALAAMPAATDALWAALAHAELGARVDSAAALAVLVGAPETYDPFAPTAERKTAIAAWRARGAIEVVP